MKSIEKLQNLLPLGYLFLVVLGIIKESVYFHLVGINILKYSSIMDILISPIATLTSHPIVLIAIILIFAFHFYLPSLLFKKRDKKWIRKGFELDKIKEEQSEEQLKNHLTNISIRMLAGVLLSFFLGFGLAGGFDASKRIKENKMDYNYRLNYNTGESEDIYVIGSNSLYYFYMAKGNKSIKIAPVGTIKDLELIKNKMLD
ncbi:hypothetical protein D3C87_249570 [compost metagenome]